MARAAAQYVDVRIDEAGQDGCAAEVIDMSSRAGEGFGVLVAANGKYAAVLDRDGLRARGARVYGDDVGVTENAVRAYGRHCEPFAGLPA
jgi:hypothetical protein